MIQGGYHVDGSGGGECWPAPAGLLLAPIDTMPERSFPTTVFFSGPPFCWCCFPAGNFAAFEEAAEGTPIEGNAVTSFPRAVFFSTGGGFFLGAFFSGWLMGMIGCFAFFFEDSLFDLEEASATSDLGPTSSSTSPSAADLVLATLLATKGVESS
ncbi:hypothetical protein TYRP_014767 [Tyrophagus putrescentiae]|nr:hypothetical protein TYRP_014767 [Tyrophagus putrescentiae]